MSEALSPLLTDTDAQRISVSVRVKVDTDMDVDQRMARELLDLQSLVELLRAAFACLGLEHDGEHRAVDALTLTCKKRG